MDPFADSCKTGLSPLKFHAFENIVEYLPRFDTLSVFDGCSFDLYNLHIKTSYLGTSRRIKIRIEETVKSSLSCREGEHIGWTSTQAFNNAGRWNTWGLYRRFLVEERHVVRDGQALTLRYIQAGIDGRGMVDMRKSGLLYHLLDLFKEDEINKVSGFLF